MTISITSCKHGKWYAKKIPISDGRETMREFCAQCGVSSGGTRLGFVLPMIADRDLKVASYKHKGKTLGEIYDVDKSYLVWLVKESKTSSRIRTAAARILCGMAFVPHAEGEVYSDPFIPAVGWECIEKVKNLPNSYG